MRSKQLGALLDAVPPATSRPLQPLTADREPPGSGQPSPPESPASAKIIMPEVPLQVLIPQHVREQLGIMAAKERASLRTLILRAVRSLGIEVTNEEIKGRRSRR